MRTVTRGILLVAIVAGLSVAASAQPPAGRGMGHGAGQGMGQMGMGRGSGSELGPFAKLNLTPDQRQQIQKLMADERSKHQGDMTKMQQLHEQVRDALFADDGPKDVSGIMSQVEQLQRTLLQSQIDLHTEIARVLTPEQRKKFREMPMMGMMPGMMAPGQRPPAKK